MTRENVSVKKVLIVAGSLLISAAAGFYNLASSMNDHVTAVVSSIVLLVWMGVCTYLAWDKIFSIELVCTVGLILGVCFASGMLLSQSFIGMLFIWPFRGIMVYFSDIMDERLTVFCLYIFLFLYSLAIAFRNAKGKRNS